MLVTVLVTVGARQTTGIGETAGCDLPAIATVSTTMGKELGTELDTSWKIQNPDKLIRYGRSLYSG